MNSKLQKYFEQYRESHSHPINLLIHKIAIPLIVFHIVAMLNWITLFQIGHFNVTLAYFAICAVCIYYITLDILYAFFMMLFILSCLFLSNFTPVWLVWTIAIVAWTFQLIGHYFFEKKSPAFSQNFIQILTGPLFIFRL